MRTYLEHKDKTTAEDIYPHYITPKMSQMRLQKLMDEYVAGCSTDYSTNAKARSDAGAGWNFNDTGLTCTKAPALPRLGWY